MSTLKRYNLLSSWYQPDTRCQHMLHGQLASEHNEMLIQETIHSWSMIIEDLLLLDGFSEQQRNAKLRTWHSVCSSLDFALVIVTCKHAYDLLIDILSKQNTDVCYADFKDQLSCYGLTTALIGQLFAPISGNLSDCLASRTIIVNGVYQSGAVKSLRVCSHFLTFPLKVNFTEIGMEETALGDYLALEQTNKTFVLPRKWVRDSLTTIITDWLGEYRYDLSLAKHGAGAVADSKNSKSDKFHSFKSDGLLDYLFGQEQGRDFHDPLPSVVQGLYNKKGLERSSRLVFVPKDVTKVRSISMEPAGLQYLQQAALRSMRKYMDSHEIGKHIQLGNQHQNRSLAYDGSCTNKYATLDMSSASDLVKWILTKDLIRKCPHLLRVLYATRSTHTILPDGSMCELYKFAPMGSALCFPIESIIFASIAKLSVLLADEQGLLTDPETGVHSTFFSVFGDDTIVPVGAAEICSELLVECGFRLNKAKSFLSGPFKESCGGNYFCGHDVTGLKFKPDFDEAYKSNVSPSAYAALIMYANMAYTRGFKVFRCYCIKKLLGSGTLPLFSDNPDNSSTIFSPAPTNFHLERRYNAALQREEVRRTTLATVEQTVAEWESERYSDWCISFPSQDVNLWKRNKYGGYSANCNHVEKHDRQSSRTLKFRKCWATEVASLDEESFVRTEFPWLADL